MIDWAERAKAEILKTADRATAVTAEIAGNPKESSGKGISAVLAVRHLPISGNSQTTTASPRVELIGLIKVVGTLYAFTSEEFSDAQDVAFASPIEALASYRDVAKRQALHTPADDRVMCGECLRLVRGRCQAAELGLMEDTQRDYSPVADVPRRCQHFKPKGNP
jgi:hypothetical protein